MRMILIDLFVAKCQSRSFALARSIKVRSCSALRSESAAKIRLTFLVCSADQVFFIDFVLLAEWVSADLKWSPHLSVKNAHELHTVFDTGVRPLHSVSGLHFLFISCCDRMCTLIPRAIASAALFAFAGNFTNTLNCSGSPSISRNSTSS